MSRKTRRTGARKATPEVGRTIIMRPVSELIPSIRNPRQHSPEHVAHIATLIKTFGFTIPVLVDERGEILAGHGRLLGAKSLGMAEVPVIVATGWTEAQKRAYRIADNKITESGQWDDHILREELSALAGDFPLDAMGFAPAEIDQIFAGENPLEVREVETSEVQDRFWIVVRGPLSGQAEALKRLKDAMGDLGEVSVEAGTIAQQEAV